MHKQFLSFLLAAEFAGRLAAGPIPPPSTGYGAHGSFAVAIEQFPSPLWPASNVTVYRPAGAGGPVPTIFFAHGYQGTSPIYYEALLSHLASRGYAAVFSPYKTVDTSDLSRYLTMAAGFVAAVDSYPQYLDSSRVGFAGHSFGAGAIPSLARRGIVDEGWGADGAFMFSMAPWYSYDITQEELWTFPSNVKLVMQNFDDDRVNDHRMAVDIFENINIADSEKDFVTLYSDTNAAGALAADHLVPLGATGTQFTDALDYYGIHRLIDALADYAFTGNLDGKNVALGNGSPEQTFMGNWPNMTPVRPLTVTDNPAVAYAQSEFTFPWASAYNPRLGVAPGCIAGDVDCDGNVDFQDFLMLQATFGTTSGAVRSDGDLDDDQDVDIQDFFILQANFGAMTADEMMASDIRALTAVPEPATLVLLVLGACGAAAWRLRQWRNRREVA